MSYISSLFVLCPLVFCAGFIDSIAGGGGLIALPAYYFVGLPPQMALGSNKFSSTCGSAFASARYIKNKAIDYRVALCSMPFAYAGSTYGAWLALRLSEEILRIVMIIGIPCIAVFILFKKDLGDTPQNRSKAAVISLSCITGFTIGMYDGFFGPGAGTFLLISFTALIGMELVKAAGTARLVNLISCFASVVVFISKDKVDYSLAVPAAAFNIAGSLLGSGLAIKNGKKIIRPIFLLILTLLFIKILYDVL